MPKVYIEFDMEENAWGSTHRCLVCPLRHAETDDCNILVQQGVKLDAEWLTQYQKCPLQLVPEGGFRPTIVIDSVEVLEQYVEKRIQYRHMRG